MKSFPMHKSARLKISVVTVFAGAVRSVLILCVSRGSYSPSQVESSRSGSSRNLVVDSHAGAERQSTKPETASGPAQTQAAWGGVCLGFRSSRLDQGPAQSRNLVALLRGVAEDDEE